MSLRDKLEAMKEQLSPDAYALLGEMVDEHKTAADADLALSQRMGEHTADIESLKARDISELVDQLTTRMTMIEQKPVAVEDDGARVMIAALSARLDAMAPPVAPQQG